MISIGRQKYYIFTIIILLFKKITQNNSVGLHKIRQCNSLGIEKSNQSDSLSIEKDNQESKKQLFGDYGQKRQE